MINKVITCSCVSNARDLDEKINKELLNISKIGKLIDIKYIANNSCYSAMIIYEVKDKSITNTDTLDNKLITSTKAEWITWAGWIGNHDERIEDSKCSLCGYIHPKVFKSTTNLSQICLSCKSIMSVREFG